VTVNFNLEEHYKNLVILFGTLTGIMAVLSAIAILFYMKYDKSKKEMERVIKDN
jgi:hypothetical protein